MDHTAGLGRGTQAGSCMHASLLQNDCDLVPVQHGRGQHRSVTISEELPARCLSHIPGRQGRQGYLRTENILVTFDSRGSPASRAPLPLASAFPDFSHHRPWHLGPGDGCIRVFHAQCHKEASVDKEPKHLCSLLHTSTTWAHQLVCIQPAGLGADMNGTQSPTSQNSTRSTGGAVGGVKSQ